MGTWALVLRKRSTRFKKNCAQEILLNALEDKFLEHTWRNTPLFVSTSVSSAASSCCPASQRAHFTIHLLEDSETEVELIWWNRCSDGSTMLEFWNVSAHHLSAIVVYLFFYPPVIYTHTHNHTITQTWLHKHPADFQPRPSRSSSFLFCHIYNGAVISCSLEQPAGPGGEPLRRMTLRLRSVCATLHRHAAGSLVLRAFTSVFYIHSKRKCFGNSRV